MTSFSVEMPLALGPKARGPLAMASIRVFPESSRAELCVRRRAGSRARSIELKTALDAGYVLRFDIGECVTLARPLRGLKGVREELNVFGSLGGGRRAERVCRAAVKDRTRTRQMTRREWVMMVDALRSDDLLWAFAASSLERLSVHIAADCGSRLEVRETAMPMASVDGDASSLVLVEVTCGAPAQGCETCLLDRISKNYRRAGYEVERLGPTSEARSTIRCLRKVQRLDDVSSEVAAARDILRVALGGTPPNIVSTSLQARSPRRPA